MADESFSPEALVMDGMHRYLLRKQTAASN